MTHASSRGAAWLGACVVTLVALSLDQGSKALIVRAFDPGQESNVFYGLDLTFVKNDGIAFGALAGGGILIIGLVVVSIVLLVGYFVANAERPYAWLATGLILGGALGNVLDRLRLGYVVDFIDPIAWPAFNLADAFIVVGVVLLILVISSPTERTRPA